MTQRNNTKLGKKMRLHYQYADANCCSYFDEYEALTDTQSFVIDKLQHRDNMQWYIQADEYASKASTFSTKMKIKYLKRLLLKRNIILTAEQKQVFLSIGDSNDRLNRHFNIVNELFFQEFKHVNEYVETFKKEWLPKADEHGILHRPESLLGKYKDEELMYLEGNDKNIEMWDNINALQYCTVDIAVRSIALMRNEFCPEYKDKMKLAVANIAIKRLASFDALKPYKLFKPNNEQGICATKNDVDLNYICLGSYNKLSLEIKDEVRKTLTVGLRIEANDILIERVVNSLKNKEFADVKYSNLNLPVLFKNDSWLTYDDNRQRPEAVGDNLRFAPWTRNHEINKTPTKYQALVMHSDKKIYVHIAWISDLMHSIENARNEYSDAFLSDLGRYEYFGEEGEEKHILIGKPWQGKVKNDNGEDVKWCEPNVSQEIIIKSSGMQKPKQCERKNQLSANAHMIHSRKRRKIISDVEVIKMSFDRHVACKRAALLNLHEEKQFDKDLWQQYKFMSKEDLLRELQVSQPHVYDKSFPDDFVQDEYDFRLKTKRWKDKQHVDDMEIEES